MSEFGEVGKERINAGGANLSKYNRLDPTLSSMQKYFPDSKFTIYTNNEKLFYKYKERKNIKIIEVDRLLKDCRGQVVHNFYQLLGLYHSKEDIAVAIDSDMIPISEDVKWLPKLIKKFGLCVPLNPRYIVRFDNRIGGDGKQDLECDVGLVPNCTPFGFYTSNKRAANFINDCIDQFEKMGRDHKYCRLPLVLWKASWKLGYSPYILPPQWCVCKEHLNIKHKIILHVGHGEVLKYYEDNYRDK